MDEQLKKRLKEAMDCGKEAVGEMKKVIQNISKEMTEKATAEGEDPHKTASELFEEVTANLKELGKTSFEFTQAAFSGIIAGMKESIGNDKETNLFRSIAGSLGRGAKHLGNAATYVAKESVKGVKEYFQKKNSDRGGNTTDTK